MQDWLVHISSSLVTQAGTWFVGIVLAVLGVFSGHLVEKIKFALNRADLRSRYYEEMATDISHFVFIINRIIKYTFGGHLDDDEGNSAIASEYNEVMNAICQKEYVYLSWFHRYWRQSEMVDAFAQVMEAIRAVDAELLLLKVHNGEMPDISPLKLAYEKLQHAAHTLLTNSVF